MVARFLLYNSDIKYNDEYVIDAISGKYKTMEEYIEQVIYPTQSDPQMIVVVVTPLVLRISIDCLIFDPNSIDNPVLQSFSAKNPYLDYTLNDSLDLHEEKMSLLFVPKQYKIIYPIEFFQGDAKDILLHVEEKLEMFPKTEQKEEFKKTMKENDEDFWKDDWELIDYYCSFCKEPIGKTEDSGCPCKKYVKSFHKNCWKLPIQVHIIKELILNKKVKDLAKCPFCKEDHLTLENIYDTFGKEIYIDLVKTAEKINEHNVKEEIESYMHNHSRNEEQKCKKCDNIIKPKDIKVLNNLYVYNESLVPFLCPNEKCRMVIDNITVSKFLEDSAYLFSILHHCGSCGILVRNSSELNIMNCDHLRCTNCAKTGNPCKLCVYTDRKKLKCLKCKEIYLRFYTYPLKCGTEICHRICYLCRSKEGDEKKCPICQGNLKAKLYYYIGW